MNQGKQKDAILQQYCGRSAANLTRVLSDRQGGRH
jgi:hypothetical protein